MARILVTEDSSFTRRALCKMLREQGHETVEAAGGAEALAQLAAGGVDLMILDLLMPKPDGLDVLGRLQSTRSPVPVIVCSADVQEASRQLCAGLGAFGFLRKPPKPAELAAWVDKALASRPAVGP
jgi:twitching motility two-component system response regulator PilH